MRKLVLTVAALAIAAPAYAQTVGVAVEIPGPAVTYVERAEAPSVRIEESVAVGATLPATVELRPIPEVRYRYAIVNDRRVIVEPETRRIVRVIE